MINDKYYIWQLKNNIVVDYGGWLASVSVAGQAVSYSGLLVSICELPITGAQKIQFNITNRANYMSREKDLTKKTAILAIGKISTQFVSFLLLPLYTALLSKSEYGAVDLIVTIAHLLIPISSLMIDQGVFRYLLNCESDEEKKTVISSAFAVTCLSTICCFIIFIIASLFVNNPYKFWVLLILVSISFSNLFLQIARGLKHTSDYALGSFVCSSITIVMNVICIAALKMGSIGMLTATFVGNFACTVFLLFKLKLHKYISISQFSTKIIKQELQYSTPLVPNQLSLWVMNSSDRFIISFFLGTSANGLLAVSHKFPTLYMSVFNIFQLAWHEMGAVHYSDEDRDDFFSDMLKKVITIFSTICMCILVALPIVFNCFINVNYHEAYYNIPIYLIASLFNVVVGLLGVVYVATKRTSEISKTTMLAAALNIVVNFALIRFIGLYAASISTFVGYGLTMIYRMKDVKKYLNIKYDVKQFAGIGISLAICTIIYYLDNKLISIIFLPVFLVAAYFINRETVNGALKAVNNKIDGKINKKFSIPFVATVSAIIIALSGIYIHTKVSKMPKEIGTAYNGDIISIKAENVVKFSDFKSENFTCTGLTYDSAEDSFWIGDYGALTPEGQKFPRIVEINKDFTTILRVIDLSDTIDSSANLQGISYDFKDNSLWLAIGDSVVELSKENTILSRIDISEYSNLKANGICYSTDDTLWILFATKYLVHLNMDGNELDRFEFNYSDQDHICIRDGFFYVTVGADYQGNNNYICKVDMTNGGIDSVYRIEQANALEGICCVDNRLFVVNDGAYHSDIMGCSYITVFNLQEFLQ